MKLPDGRFVQCMPSEYVQREIEREKKRESAREAFQTERETYVWQRYTYIDRRTDACACAHKHAEYSKYSQRKGGRVARLCLEFVFRNFTGINVWQPVLLFSGFLLTSCGRLLTYCRSILMDTCFFLVYEKQCVCGNSIQRDVLRSLKGS